MTTDWLWINEDVTNLNVIAFTTLSKPTVFLHYAHKMAQIRMNVHQSWLVGKEDNLLMNVTFDHSTGTHERNHLSGTIDIWTGRKVPNKQNQYVLRWYMFHQNRRPWITWSSSWYAPCRSYPIHSSSTRSWSLRELDSIRSSRLRRRNDTEEVAARGQAAAPMSQWYRP